METMDVDNKKPFKIKDVTRNIKKAVVAASLEEIRSKVAEKFEKAELLPTIHLDSDGTEIDDEEYFRTLDANTELIAVFPGEHWIDPTHYVTITSHRSRERGDSTDGAAETARIKQLVGQLQNNLCNVSVMSDPDLDSLSNMDPNSLVDITGKDFMDQLKDSGRPLCAKRNAEDRINLLKLLKDGAIFCSERYPEDAEAIDMEISRQLNVEMSNTETRTILTAAQPKTTATINTNTNTTTTTTTITLHCETNQQLIDENNAAMTKTIEHVQNGTTTTEDVLANNDATMSATQAAVAAAAAAAATTTGNNKTNDI